MITIGRVYFLSKDLVLGRVCPLCLYQKVGLGLALYSWNRVFLIMNSDLCRNMSFRQYIVSSIYAARSSCSGQRAHFPIVFSAFIVPTEKDNIIKIILYVIK